MISVPKTVGMNMEANSQSVTTVTHLCHWSVTFVIYLKYCDLAVSALTNHSSGRKDLRTPFQVLITAIVHIQYRLKY